MTPSPQQTGHQGLMGRMRQKMTGWRGDGQQVPGNEPGGANGRYGRYGQSPDAAIPQDFSHSVRRAAMGGVMDSPAGQMVQGLHDRYSSHRRGNPQGSGIDPAMTQEAGPMQPQEPPSHGYGSFMNQQQQGPSDEYMAAKQAQEQAHPGSTMSDEDTMEGYQQNQQNAYPPQQPTVEPQQQNATPDNQAPAQPAAPAQSPPQPQSNTTASPFGTMNFGGTPQMAKGRIVTQPTRAIIGDDGPEAVVPLDNPGAHVTPGMFSQHRYRAMTGPSMLHHPMRPMAPASLDPQMNNHKYGR